MADSYVCSGATMRCAMGTSPAKLTVLPSRAVFLTGQPMVNISDHLTKVNLAPFGLCRSLGFPATAAATAANHGCLTPRPCMHNTPFPWMGGKNDYIVKGELALLKSSTCSCMWGGTISIIDDGQHGEGTQWVQKQPEEKYNVVDSTKDLTIDNSEALDLRPKSERKSLDQVIKESKSTINRQSRESIEAFLTTTANGGIIWNNSRFSKLEEENVAFLNSKGGKAYYKKAKDAFESVQPNLYSISKNQLYQIVGQTMGLKSNEILYGKEEKTQTGILGWHPRRSNKAILNRNEETNMSMCQKIAVYAHESRHVFQDVVIAGSKNLDSGNRSEYANKLIEADKKYESDQKESYQDYYNNYKEEDARKFEIIFGKACVDYYNETNNAK